MEHLTLLFTSSQVQNVPFYLTQGFWTFVAVLVALVSPWIVDSLNKRIKKSRLKYVGISIVNQHNDDGNPYNPGPFDVGRVALENTGKHKARSVEAYLEKIISEGKERPDFFPVPLSWTHGELNKGGLSVRDIYPNQTVYLDIFNYVFDPEVVGDSAAFFAVAAGQGVDNLSRMNHGESKILVKFYQESGQVDRLWLDISWDLVSIPSMARAKTGINLQTPS